MEGAKSCIDSGGNRQQHFGRAFLVIERAAPMSINVLQVAVAGDAPTATWPRMMQPTFRQWFGIVVAGFVLASGSAIAQSRADIRAQLDGAALGVGYAQIIGLAATPEIATASYTINSHGIKQKVDVFRLPYQAKWLALTPDSDLYWRIAGGYLSMKDSLPATIPPGGSVDAKWTAYSAGAGLLARIRLGSGFTLEPAIDVGIARLENSATYNGGVAARQPLLDGLIFNWKTNASLVTPSIGIEYASTFGEAKATGRANVARSWIASFDASDVAQSFNETANVYSIRADYSRPAGLTVAARPLNWVAYGGYAGFFGPNRDALGFSTVAEIGAGLELPVSSDRPQSERARLAVGFLFGPEVRGWTVGVSMQY